VQADAVPLLQELIRAGRDPTCKEAIEAVRAACKGWRVTEGHGFVWVQPGDRARLVLSGHLDVVPPGDGWAVAPFGGAQTDGEVWGRGACDMKGAIAAMLAAAREVGPGDWALALTTDEETGMRGAHALLGSGAIEGAELVVVGEPTGMQLGVGHRGVLWLEIGTQGRAAHGSTPHEGDSAIAKMLRLLRAVEGFALPEKHGLLGGSTLNLGVLRGGEAVNVVPSRCAAQLDLRVPPPGSTAQARRALLAALNKADVPFDARVLGEHDPFEARPGPLLDRVRHWLREAAPEARDVGLPYGTEASVYQRHAPCVVVGPGQLAHMHARDERVALADVRAAQRFYRTLLEAWS
jgi:succinyl-diaminopimelate desuccinylase